jgi:Rps23 Pro-64 3,4-dihydroxylase Tpa1-like proline 4-hydroxylase
MIELNRRALANRILERLEEQADASRAQWQASGTIQHFVLDDLLPDPWARAVHRAFPAREQMWLKRSLREKKYVAAQMNHYEPLLEEAIFAFQSSEVVRAIERITGLRALEPDDLLYAGGISLMTPGQFLNPHMDNSHDKFRQRYRLLNLLYYVSPDWTEECGGNLELWPQGVTGGARTLVSRFNRLVVMLTDQRSWHSVSRVLAPRDRCCVSNYYFSRYPATDRDYFHVTSFRGRPGQPIRDLLLRGDQWLRTAIRRVFPQGIKENPHYYKKGPHG